MIANASVNTILSWTGGDPDYSDTVTYDVYFGTSSNPPLISSGQTATSFSPGTLAYNTVYYWWIIGIVPGELPGDIPLEEDPPVLDRVDGYDVNEIAKGFGKEIGDPYYNPNADLDGNGKVDGNDLMILGPNHGKKK